MPDAEFSKKKESGVAMKPVLHPWQMLLLILAGRINQQQQHAIEYLIAENRILREKIGKKRILLTDNQRQRLAVKGKVLGWKALAEICSIVTPETVLRWHRGIDSQEMGLQQVSQEGGTPRHGKRGGRACGSNRQRKSRLGYNRIRGALANLGCKISETAIGNMLRNQGIGPAPERKKQTTWKTFLEVHWDVLAAIDFTTIEVWTKSGLCTLYLLFITEMATRRICFAGCTQAIRMKIGLCRQSET
jgi:putative transposase